MTERITILHTNDIHSHFENWPRIRRFLTQRRQSLSQQANSAVITVDLGDAVDRVHPLTEVTNGKANVELLNQIHYDAVTIGNNEGLTNTHEQLDELYADANFDVILANILDQRTNQIPGWAKPFKIITTPKKTRVLIIGLTAPYELTYPILGWQPLPPEQVLPKLLAENKDHYDIAVLLSHLGHDVDRRLARQFPQLDIIIGSHTHHLLAKGERVNHSLLAAAEKWGHYVGEITIDLDAAHHIVADQATVVKTATLPAEKTDQAEIDEYAQHGEHLLARNKLARLKMPMTTHLVGHSRLVDEGLRAIMEKADTQAGILNSGLFLRNLPTGIVDRNQLHQMLPHAMHVMRVTLDGYNLWRLIKEMEKNDHFLIKFPQKGMGFRGKYFGELHFSGLRYDNQAGQLFFREELVSPINTYQIAMPDHYLFIPFFPTLDIIGKNEILYDQNLRDVFGDYLAKHYPLNS
ncbi:multifunctional 2',3'-cyclic-nucleotide 2'-phosphodiesterase/5'-nucleotidase/3'-nucleotidase [Lentilactobacillus fungorum]|uniref:Multifunctional 2',3'-cyclic-nucleotide 2'-phosphodiesterase/5'-nucleotidase/3'-nucleotidase n=1 Tax=Lentilactobacillus fungorum TaxID=2201250 RepID=A0ABQ3VWH2_9LACO|nr:bifunctional metallophosphatase/5'-nucleotidase [Lentilactobacillus fungorum]GHP12657.1 multifunctional 2',3'-cyclic-nucleotide 2'-phosphodiesterase/5'-nucleotidase/3'-nucleotidase [Lentilactobacillus fungorum]